MLQSLRTFIRTHWIALLIALIINLLVLTNAMLQHPKIGYDTTAHITYMQVLPYRLPTPADTTEYFSAPLGYFLPSLYDKVCVAVGWSNCRGHDGRAAQIINVFLSIGITILFWKISDLLKPGNEVFRISLLAMLGILTVYYKTFSQARSEPYVAFFTCLIIWMILKILKNLEKITWKIGVELGVVLGLLILSRQWGIFLLPALVVITGLVLIKDHSIGWRLTKIFALSGLVAFLVGGWFYLHLYFDYGSFGEFNMESKGFSFANEPASFYTGLGWWPKHAIIHAPIRPNFDNQFFPIFYSDTWGDYWGFFSFVNPNEVNLQVNRDIMGPYLGRVNIVSIFPTIFLMGGLALGAVSLVKVLRKKNLEPEHLFRAFLFCGILFSMLGYFWFLISYPNLETGVTNKPTYMIQAFMLLLVLAADLLERLNAYKPLLFRISMLILAFIFVHNLPALISHFNPLTNLLVWK